MTKKKVVLTEKQLESLKDSFKGYPKLAEKIREKQKGSSNEESETETE